MPQAFTLFLFLKAKESIKIILFEISKRRCRTHNQWNNSFLHIRNHSTSSCFWIPNIVQQRIKVFYCLGRSQPERLSGTICFSLLFKHKRFCFLLFLDLNRSKTSFSSNNKMKSLSFNKKKNRILFFSLKLLISN